MSMATRQGLRACMFIGSAREKRLGDRVSKFMISQMKKTGWTVDVVDAAEADLPVLKKPIFFYDKSEEVPEVLGSILDKIKVADAFVIVTCEYNHCLPPGLLNLIDHFAPSAYSKRPSGIVCYSPGMFGGIRAAMQARCLLSEINTVSIPNIFAIPKVNNCLDSDGNPTDDHMISGAQKHLVELEWYARALKVARDADNDKQ
ncbi:hypothetical protein EB796_023028 [Bugula neritina]|uniref:NADPH-dependent FMN reductase-like domain-containing protein n=1 Tax=Bugula neritina TaxID=10212 RepID=A0A7J7IXW4_BUGNE|nr:hypothetical protein EB796_023028 [Bugula neritina]